MSEPCLWERATVPILVAGSAVRTALGDTTATFDALVADRSGVGPLRHADADHHRVKAGYHLAGAGAGTAERRFLAGAALALCVTEALADAGVPAGARLPAVIGTGLRELCEVERWGRDGAVFAAERLHFGPALLAAVDRINGVLTVCNACSAGGYALALAQDMLELGDADAVVVGAADTMTCSMLAMIGRFTERPVDQLRPFDADSAGVLLGEGAAALVLVPDDTLARPGAVRVLGTGLSCDAFHETAPDAGGIGRAMTDAFARAGRTPRQVDLVLAHGTGTALNDPLEAAVLREVFGDTGAGPLVTAIKGGIGHTSGVAALHSVAVAAESMRRGLVPPVVGLREPLPDGKGLRLVRGAPVAARPDVAMVNAFGFGGVNAVTVLEAVR